MNQFKIHGLPTCAKSSCHANDTFYATEEDAIAKIQHIFNTQPNAPVMVIYKAHCVVERADAPIKITDIASFVDPFCNLPF
jgi:hypothetical protein